MKIPTPSTNRGSALVMVLVFSAVTLIVIASALNWSASNTTLSGRNNEYFRTVAVAEAATEKALSHLVKDYKQGGDALVRSKDYSTILPSSAENAAFASYEFSDVDGRAGRIFVQPTAATEYRVLTAQYNGLRGSSTPLRIAANAKQKDSLYQIRGGVEQCFELTTIPLFQFAIFYNIDLEIAPGPEMQVNGPVHCNQDLYVCPGDVLTFHNDITAAGTIIMDRKDGTACANGKTVFRGRHAAGLSSLNLPIGTNNSAQSVREVVEVPPGYESPDSEMGKERFFNKADLVILVSNTTMRVSSGRINNFATVVPKATWWAASNPNSGFLSTNKFFNKRENKTVISLDIDIAKLVRWNLTNKLLRPVLAGGASAGEVTIVYVADYRTVKSTTQSGVRLVNGKALPPKGLTIATPSPIYVWGNYNCPDAALGTTNTSQTKPAALIGDAITILSTQWNDSNADDSLSSRIAGDTTVNAAFLAGIVETKNSMYSGGVENFPRFLERWTGKTFTYNGSMVVMFPSNVAKGAWGGTGDEFGIYDAPDRMWSFDENFRSLSKLPPGTPMARGVVRNRWTTFKTQLTK